MSSLPVRHHRVSSLLVGVFCLFFIWEGRAADQLPLGKGFEGEPLEIRVAALSNWSPVLLRFDSSEQGEFEYRQTQRGVSMEILYKPGSEGFFSDSINGVRGGSPAFMIGQKRMLDSDRVLFPTVDGLAELAGPGNADSRSIAAGGLFYVLMSPAVWDVMRGSISDEDAVSARPHTDDRRNELFHIIRARPENQLHFAQAQRLHAGKEAVVVLVWIPVVPRFGRCGEISIALPKLRFVEQDFNENPVARLVGRIDWSKIEPQGSDSSAERGVKFLLGSLRSAFDSAQKTESDKRSEDHTANDLLNNIWNLRLGEQVREIYQPESPFSWDMPEFKDVPQWTYHLHWYRLFNSLASAYTKTGNAEYARKWVEITEDWIRQNPPGSPASWRSLVAAIRTQTILQQLKTFYNQPILEDVDRVALLNLIADHADFLADPIMYHPANNWGTAETSSLQMIASRFPMFINASHWAETAEVRRLAALHELVNPDGSTDEMTIGYHVSVLESLFRSASPDEMETPGEFRQAIEKMYDYIMCFVRPDGSLPLLGHSYKSSAVPILKKGYARLKKPIWEYVVSRGKRGKLPSYLDTRLESSPHFVMRTDWVDSDALYLCIKGTTRGRPGMDGFNLDLYAYGRTLLPDSGAYSYNPPWRDLFSETRFHSTVTVDNRNQARGSDVTLNQWNQTKAFSYFDGTLTPYDGVEHRRRVLMMREHPGYILVLDDLTGEMPGVVSSRFWFPPEPSQVVMDHSTLAAHTCTENQADVLVQEVMNREARVYLEDGWFSENYGEKEARKGMVVEAPGLPCSFGTLIYPFEKSREAPALRASWDSDTQSFVIHHDQGTDQIRLHPGFGLPDVHRTLKGE